MLIAAAAITTSFFGSRAIRGGELSGWVLLALVAFIVVGGSVLTVLWPRTDWSFSASAADIIAEDIEPEPVDFQLLQRADRIALYRRRDLQPPAVPELREAVQQNDERPVAGLDVMQPHVPDIGVAVPEFGPAVRNQCGQRIRRAHGISSRDCAWYARG
jgi:hypothetical protein